MQTVLEILNKTTEYFKKCGVPDPRLDAQYILAHGLGMTRMDLYLKIDRPVTDEELAKMRPMVQRRGKREPLQHIVGSTSFCGHEIKCDARALIPRPETEVLVEQALLLIKDIPTPHVIDVGTGTGAIAIAIALARPEAVVFACDISDEALALTKENIAHHHLEDRIMLCKSNLLDTLCKSNQLEGIGMEAQFDLIASNLPYIPTQTLPSLQAEVLKFDPTLALDGGADGLLLINKLLNTALSHLKEGGKILLEVGEGQSESLQSKLLPSTGLEFVKTYADLAGVKRFPLFRKKISVETM